MRQKMLRELAPQGGDTRQYRYWSPTAQQYAAGDQLLRFLADGWDLEDRVEVETYWFGEGRHIVIYHLILLKGKQRLPMPVLGGPFVRQLMRVNDALTPVTVRQSQPKIALERLSKSSSSEVHS